MKNLVIIPTYNEKENIEAIITAVMELPIEYHVLVIDDGSPDGTASIVKDLMANKFAGKLHLAPSFFPPSPLALSLSCPFSICDISGSTLLLFL